MTKQNKRVKVEQYVNNHPTLSKVADFNSNLYGIEKNKLHEKLITFLIKESTGIANNILCGVKSFEFNPSSQSFVNRTKTGSFI